MSDLDQSITDYATGILLRYYRAGLRNSPGVLRIESERDREILRSHWALSEPVLGLMSYLLTHPHEASALLSTEQRIEDSLARGRIDMRATLLHRRWSGSPTALVTDVAVRDYETGPNHLLAWVIYHAKAWSAPFQEHKAANSGKPGPAAPASDLMAYANMAEAILLDIDRIRRFGSLRDLLLSPAVSRRPSQAALRDASRSRRPVYRLAVSAYNLLKGVEEGSEEAIQTIIGSTLIGPLEVWRRLELAVATTIGEAVAAETGERLVLNPVISGAKPLLTCGRYALFWQQDGSLYKKFKPTEPERRSKEILEAYDVPFGRERPDLVLVNQDTKQVVSVIEVKYLTGDTAKARFRQAVGQVVHYTRGYASGLELGHLVGRSLVVMSTGAPTVVKPGPEIPTALDFHGITQGLLSPWVRSLLVPLPRPTNS